MDVHCFGNYFQIRASQSMVWVCTDENVLHNQNIDKGSCLLFSVDIIDTKNIGYRQYRYPYRPKKIGIIGVGKNQYW